MKSFFKNILVSILGWQIRRLRRKNKFKIIGVTGSIGKTSTKLAIAQMLQTEKRVRYQEGNYNDIVSVPLVFFGEQMPNILNIFSWIKIIFNNEFKILSEYPYDFVVLELGTDKPGQINEFRKYLHLDVAVITAITPEHMEFFVTLEEVAAEEWSVNFFSDIIFANKDLCTLEAPNIDHKKLVSYGKNFGSLYKIENISKNPKKISFDISLNGKKIIEANTSAFSDAQIYSISAAVSIAHHFKIPIEKIEKNIKNIKSFSGRMQRLQGINDSTIIDDTYNASPEAVKMALETLYDFEAPQRIAILGMMNELGVSSEEEHVKIGKLCDPKFLDLVVTIGKDANAFTAPIAEANGCKVYKAKNAVDAGEYLKNKIQNGAVILAKGSQNGVFAEEALKPLLANKSDISKLVRQDEKWMRVKNAQFGS